MRRHRDEGRHHRWGQAGAGEPVAGAAGGSRGEGGERNEKACAARARHGRSETLSESGQPRNAGADATMHGTATVAQRVFAGRCNTNALAPQESVRCNSPVPRRLDRHARRVAPA